MKIEYGEVIADMQAHLDWLRETSIDNLDLARINGLRDGMDIVRRHYEQAVANAPQRSP